MVFHDESRPWRWWSGPLSRHLARLSPPFTSPSRGLQLGTSELIQCYQSLNMPGVLHCISATNEQDELTSKEFYSHNSVERDKQNLLRKCTEYRFQLIDYSLFSYSIVYSRSSHPGPKHKQQYNPMSSGLSNVSKHTYVYLTSTIFFTDCALH